MPSIPWGKFAGKAVTYTPQHKEVITHAFARQNEDWYVEDQWVSKALLKYLALPPWETVLDPFCGGGNILHMAQHFGHGTAGLDIVNRMGDSDSIDAFNLVDAFQVADLFLTDEVVISNPPYDRVNDLFDLMIERGIGNTVALFLPLPYISGKAKRLAKLPFSELLVLSPRPNCLPGHLVKQGLKPEGGKRDFAWFIFQPKHEIGTPWQGSILTKDTGVQSLAQ
jgi:hypothetical protein